MREALQQAIQEGDWTACFALADFMEEKGELGYVYRWMGTHEKTPHHYKYRGDLHKVFIWYGYGVVSPYIEGKHCISRKIGLRYHPVWNIFTSWLGAVKALERALTLMAFVENDLVAGVITYATIVEDRKHQMNLEIGVEVTKKLLGDKLEDGTENVSAVEQSTRLFLGGDADSESDLQRRGIARDQIRRITGVELEDTWEKTAGYQRLVEDGKNSIHDKIVGKEVVLKAREYGGKIYWNLHFSHERPKAMSLTELKKKLAAKASGV